jgi:hypothetical protein
MTKNKTYDGHYFDGKNAYDIMKDMDGKSSYVKMKEKKSKKKVRK